jgi:AraC-like DNA-binding protein
MFFKYKQKNFKTLARELSEALQLPHDGFLVTIPPCKGNGIFYADSIDKAFSFGIMRAELNSELIISRVSNNQAGIVIYFNQVEVTEYIKFKSKGSEITDNVNKIRKNIFLSSSNKDVEVVYSPGSKLKRLGIYLSPLWVKANFHPSIITQVNSVMAQGLNHVNQMLINDAVQEKLDKIFAVDFTKEAEKIALKSRIILLLEYFFSNYFNELVEIKEKEPVPEEDLQRLKYIEELLANEETKDFPSIAALARIAHMSGTKLKQRFKQVYGFRLYEFFNLQRLEKAKKLLDEGVYAKEAGYAIGFTNVSNFSKAFKKQYGYNPGAYKEVTQIKFVNE